LGSQFSQFELSYLTDSKSVLDITHELFKLPAFLDVLEKGVPSTLPLLANLRGKRF
ncbi:hypothetical protein A1F96_11312, partial [Pyrenophora tritici-repentis]